MSDTLTDNISGLNDAVKEYAQARIDLVKLQLLKKASQTLSVLFGLLVFILLSTLILMFAGAAFVFWYGSTYNDYLAGVLIVIGFLLLFAVLFMALRKRIFTTVFLSNFSEILYDEDEKSEKK